MKSKDCVTIMITTAADGTKCPLYIVGKLKMPEALCILNNGKFPLKYTSQKHAWFDCFVMVRIL